MRRPVLVLALVCHLVLATGYLVRTPAFEGPDENGHAYYASFLAHRHSLPVVEGSSEPYGLSPWDESPVGHHPPLYYGLLAVTMQVLGHADTVPTFSLAENPTPLHFRHGHDELSCGITFAVGNGQSVADAGRSGRFAGEDRSEERV